MIDTVTNVLAVLLAVEIIAATVSSAYVASVYFASNPPRSRMFRAITRDDVLKVLAGLWIGALTVWRLSDFGRPLPTWTTPISAFVVAILLWPPIDHAITIYRLRQAKGDHTPPPFTETD